MIRTLLLAPLAALAFAAQAQAFDISDMSDAERETFRAEIREYLLENPEVLMEAIAVLEQARPSSRSKRPRPRGGQRRCPLDDGYSWVGGNPEGDVTLVEFMDYRCSFCRRAHPEVQELCGDGNIRYIVKEYPILGDESVAASRFAIAVKNVEGEDAYKTVHDELITIRGTMNEDTFGGSPTASARHRRDPCRDAEPRDRRRSRRTTGLPRGSRSRALRPSSSIPNGAGLRPARVDAGHRRSDPRRLLTYSAACSEAAFAASISAAFFSTCSTMCSIISSFESL